MRFLLLVFVFLVPLLSAEVFASAPAVEKVVIPPLKVSWVADLAIEKLGWEGMGTQKIISKTEVRLARVKYSTQKSYLIVVLKNRQWAPLRIEIPNSQNKIHLTKETFQKKSNEELWFWGETPKSQCGGFSSFHLRFLNKKSLYTNFSGLFAWKILKKELPLKPLLYLLPRLELDTPNTIVSEAFARASELSKEQCAQHHGGPCPFVFNLQLPASVRSFQIHFKGLKEKSFLLNPHCPV